MGVWLFAALLLLALCTLTAGAQEHAEDPAAEAEEGMDMASAIRVTALAFAAMFTMLGAAMGTAKVQSAVAAGGTGALAEKPELVMSVIILMAIPETIVVLGFVVSLLIWTSI